MEEQRGMDDIMVVTPPNATRTPARLRLSVSRKERPLYDSVYEEVREVDIRNHLSRSSSRKDRQQETAIETIQQKGQTNLFC
jgi:hypothetical protein